jgi:uncharacterized Rmd1/YagE family protein
VSWGEGIGASRNTKEINDVGVVESREGKSRHDILSRRSAMLGDSLEMVSHRLGKRPWQPYTQYTLVLVGLELIFSCATGQN